MLGEIRGLKQRTGSATLLNIYGITLFCKQQYVVVGGFTGNAHILLASMLVMLLAAAAHADQVAVVVDNGQTVRTACVEFSGTTTAADIASSSGLSFAFADYGGLGKAVCKIGATGRDPSNCFCDANYWAFYYS